MSLLEYRKDFEFPPWIPRPPPGLKGFRGRPPWLRSLMLAKSQDGLHFEKLDRALVDSAGVPNLIADYGKDRIIADFQYFSLEKKEDWDQIGVSFSYDEGETWTKLQITNIKGLPESPTNPVDPALVVLDDGRYRLYFCYPQPGRKTIIPPRIHSAISDDCINFTFEEGVRVMVEGKTVNDPAVAKIEGKWHYYSLVYTEQGNNYHAVSDDGLNFSIEDNIVLDMNMLGCALAVDDGYRFYGSGHEGRSSAFSTDGYTWIQEDVRMPGPDPGVVRLKDGTYLMLYTAFPPESWYKEQVAPRRRP